MNSTWCGGKTLELDLRLFLSKYVYVSDLGISMISLGLK